MNIIIIGASGYIGKNLFQKLKAYNFNLYKLSIDINKIKNFNKIRRIFDSFNPDIVIHIAGLAHQKNLKTYKYVNNLFNINTKYPIIISNICKEYRVKKFIFISSIGVHGEESDQKKINEESKYNPYNFYSLSKVYAEISIVSSLKFSNTNYTIIRPSLVIGKNAPGNIEAIKKLLKLGIPLPINVFKSKRNILDISDLCNLICKCINSKNSNDEIFVASNKKELTPLEIFTEVSKLEGLRVRSFYLPKKLLFLIFCLMGKKNQFNKLNQNYLIDSKKARKFLNWNTKN